MVPENFIHIPIPIVILILAASSSFALIAVDLDNHAGCLINVVTENGVNDNDPFPSSLQLDQNTWTVFLASKLNFGFDKDTVDSDDFVPSLNDGYYRFNFRHVKTCVVFVLLTDTFNGTITAIQNSGYGTSEYALFLINLPGLENEITTGFQNGLSNGENISIAQGFHASLAFVVPESDSSSWLNIVGVYCYSCSQEMGKIQSMSKTTNNYTTVASVIALSKTWNKNGHGHQGIFFSSAGLETLTNVWKVESCSLSLGRIEFYKNLGKCFNGDLVAIRLVCRALNLTFGFHGFSEEVDNQNWRLVLRAAPVIQKRQENTFAVYRQKVGITHQNNYKLIYCNYVQNTLWKAWNIYFTVFDWDVWLCFFIVLIVFALLIYKSFAMALDLIWPFFGMGLWYEHPKCFMMGYSFGTLFLCATYSAGVSTDFLFVDISDTVADFIKNSYKLYVTEHRNFKHFVSAAADYQIEGIRRLTGFQDASEIFYPDLEYKFPKNISSRLDAMVIKKILMLSGEANCGVFTSLAQVLELYDKVVVEDNFVCGTLELPEYMDFSHKGSFTTYGIHSQQVYENLRNLFHHGFRNQMMNLIDHKKVLEGHLMWSEAAKILGEPTSLGLGSPFGNVCFAQFGLIIAFGIVFIFQHIYFYNGCRRSKSKTTVILVSSKSGIRN